MNAPAILLMVVTILLVWGGLVGSFVALRMLKDPDVNEKELLATMGSAALAED